MSDLIRDLNIDCEVDFIKISSYSGKKSIGEINMTKGLDLDIKNRSVIIIEDIIDSGKSINYLYDYISNLNPKDIAVISLLAKKSISKLNFKIDFIGFEISSEFVVGYGLDYNQKLRNLKSIYKSSLDNLNDYKSSQYYNNVKSNFKVSKSEISQKRNNDEVLFYKFNI